MSDISQLYEKYLQGTGVQTDSRKVQAGNLFFALKGSHFNGNEFALKALEQGASYAVVDDWSLSKESDRFIYAEDGLECLQQLARYHRLKFNIPFIAVTGSNGKTTTKELLAAVLSQKYKVGATRGNFNNHIGVPLTILEMAPDTEIALIEMGANHQKEIEFYCQIALPNYGLITNCGKAHLEGFGGVEGVRKGKGELYDFLRKWKGGIFRNTDYDYLTEMAHDIPEQITYGRSNAQIIGKALHQSHFLSVAILTHGLECQINSQLTGDYNLPNLLAAVCVGDYFGVPIEDIKAALEAYRPDNSRSQWVEKGNNKIILDAYNANPSSMRVAIQNMAQLDGDNKWLLLGGMKELGVGSEAEHQGIIDFAQDLGFQHLLLCGPEFEHLEHQGQWFKDSEALLAWLKAHPIEHGLILIKGSHSTQMEKVLPAFS